MLAIVVVTIGWMAAAAVVAATATKYSMPFVRPVMTQFVAPVLVHEALGVVEVTDA